MSDTFVRGCERRGWSATAWLLWHERCIVNIVTSPTVDSHLHTPDMASGSLVAVVMVVVVVVVVVPVVAAETSEAVEELVVVVVAALSVSGVV